MSFRSLQALPSRTISPVHHKKAGSCNPSCNPAAVTKVSSAASQPLRQTSRAQLSLRRRRTCPSDKAMPSPDLNQHWQAPRKPFLEISEGSLQTLPGTIKEGMISILERTNVFPGSLMWIQWLKKKRRKKNAYNRFSWLAELKSQ